jgi:hypothetical protein
MLQSILEYSQTMNRYPPELSPDMNRQIEFIIKQLNSTENVDEYDSDDEEEDEEEVCQGQKLTESLTLFFYRKSTYFENYLR